MAVDPSQTLEPSWSRKKYKIAGSCSRRPVSNNLHSSDIMVSFSSLVLAAGAAAGVFAMPTANVGISLRPGFNNIEARSGTPNSAGFNNGCR